MHLKSRRSDFHRNETATAIPSIAVGQYEVYREALEYFALLPDKRAKACTAEILSGEVTAHS